MTNLESSRAPVDEHDGALALDAGDGGVDLGGVDVAAVQQAAAHVLALARVTLYQLVGWLEAHAVKETYLSYQNPATRDRQIHRKRCGCASLNRR